jgi:proteasome lid subunit RPN8/RPN11
MKAEYLENKNIIKIEEKAWKKMCHYHKLAEQQNTEIGGILIIDDKNGIKVKDLIVPEQTVSGGSVKLDMGSMMTNLVEKNPELLPKVFGWWHTHGNFGCFWSDTDEKTTEDLVKYGLPYCISIVQSKHFQFKFSKNLTWFLLIKLSLKKPRIDCDGLPFIIERNGFGLNQTEERENFKKNVKVKKFKPKKWKWNQDKGEFDATDEEWERLRKYGIW